MRPTGVLLCFRRNAHNCSLPRRPRSWWSACPLRLTPIFTPHTNKPSHTHAHIGVLRNKHIPSSWGKVAEHKDVIKGGEEDDGREEGREGRERLLHLSQVRLGSQGHRSPFPSPRLRAEEAAGTEEKKKKKKNPQQLPSALSQCGCDYRLTFSNVFSITMSLLRFCQVSAADLSWFTGIAGRLKSWLPYGRLRGCWGVWSAFVQMLRPAVIKQMCGRWPWLSTSCQ